MPTTTITDRQRVFITDLATQFAEAFNAHRATPGFTTLPAETAVNAWLAEAAIHPRGVSAWIESCISARNAERTARNERRRLAEAVQSIVAPGAPSPVENVPDGHYATPSTDPGDHQPLRFWRIRTPRGHRTGVQYLYRMESDNARYYGTIRNGVAQPNTTRVLDAIRAEGIVASAQRYGVEIGRCFVCNRALTDATSRSLGIGPDCRGARSRHAAWAGLDYSSNIDRITTSNVALPQTPQECTSCHDVAVGVARDGSGAYCDECAIDGDVRISLFRPAIRQRTAALA